MNNGSASKNFYSENRTYSRTPSNQNLTQQARMQNSLYSTLQNMQSLQTIKDQIQQLQNTLSTQHRKSSAQKSEVVNKTREKSSFYGLIREQLKQVNKLQSSSSEIDSKSFKNHFASKINRRQEPQQSNNSSPNNSVPKSQSLIVAKNTKAQVLKSLLNNEENQSEQYLRKQLQDKLQQLEIQKRIQINEIREKYKEERKQVEQRYQLKLQEELQIFEKKLKKTLMKSEMQQPNSSVFLYIIIAISPSDQQLKTSYHFVNKLSPKSQITSSFKKDQSFKEKKVRFEEQRFKTEDDLLRT
ncbi:hypothetical protein pb186bvf_016954 [Paramecium bursaria]